MADRPYIYTDPSVWVKNSSFSETQTVGTIYETVFHGNGSGNRIASCLIPVTSNTFTVWANTGFQVAAIAFNSDRKYLGKTAGYFAWQAIDSGGTTVSFGDNMKYVAFVLRRGTGSPALTPEQIEEVGFAWGGYEFMVLARDSITLAQTVDISGYYRFYKLQASTAAKPAKPTSIATLPPSGWSDTEPSYTEGSTNSLYFVDLVTFSDGTFEYSDVSLSSSYEAAKQAYNKSLAAMDAVDNLEIGGRNLLGEVPISYNKTAYNAYYLFMTEPIDPYQKYTLQLWGLELDANSTGVKVYYYASSVCLTAGHIRPDENGYASAILQVPENQRSHDHLSQYPQLVIYNFVSGHSGSSIVIDKWKLEKGTVPSDYSTAPEDDKNWYAECSTAAGTSAKEATITPNNSRFQLRRGATVNVKFTATNSAAVGSLTLNVNGTGAKNIKYIYNGSISNIPGVGYLKANQTYQFYYDGSYWVVQMIYNSNNIDRRQHNQYILPLENISAGKLIAGTASGYKALAASMSFDLGYPILWGAGKMTANTQYATVYEAIPSVNPATTGTVQGIAVNKMVWLKGTLSGNTFTVATTNWLTCTTPVTADGFYYIPLGVVANDSTAKMYFSTSDKLYAFVNGAFQRVDKGAAAIATATQQYFWHDTNGAHIGTVEGDGDSGYNSLWNSSGLGMRYNDKLLSLFDSNNVTFYDGTSATPTDSNIIAKFGKNGITIGNDPNTMIAIDSTNGVKIGQKVHISSSGTRFTGDVTILTGYMADFTLKRTTEIAYYPLYSKGEIILDSGTQMTVSDTTHRVTVPNEEIVDEEDPYSHYTVQYKFDGKNNSVVASTIFVSPYYKFSTEEPEISVPATVDYLDASGNSLGQKTYEISYTSVTSIGYVVTLTPELAASATKINVSLGLIDGSSCLLKVNYGTGSAIMYNTTAFLGRTDSSKTSVYIGTDGISVNEYVGLSTDGTVIARNINLCNSNAEKLIIFTNDAYNNGTTGTDIYPHRVDIYGGNINSRMAIGLYDRANKTPVWRYDDVYKIFRMEKPLLMYDVLRPAQTLTHALGTEDYRWNNAYIRVIQLGAPGKNSDGTMKYGAVLGTYWADGAAHNLVWRGDDGLTTYIGWAGDSTHVAEVAANAKLRVTGTITASKVTAYTPSWKTNQNPVRYQCVVSAGICSFWYMGNAVAHTANTQICQLPEGARPKIQVTAPFIKMTGAVVGVLTITSAGVVSVSQISNTTNTGRIYFNISYAVANT